MSRARAHEAVAADARTAGVVRTTNLRGLDTLGFPVISATRAGVAEGGVTVYSAADRDAGRARIRALAEAVERWASEPERCHAVATSADSPVHLPALNPSDGNVPPAGWLRGTGMQSGRPCDLPVNAVLFPLPPPWPAAPSTNGLAWGLDLASASRRALRELVERDAESRLLCLLAGDHQPPPEVPGHALGLGPLLERVEPWCAARVADLTHDLGWPVALVLLRDRELGTVHQGVACRSTLRAAAEAALLEAVQGRAVDRQGAREDIEITGRPLHPWYLRDVGPTPPGPLPRRSTRSVLRGIQRLTGHEPVVVDLSPPGLRGRVVRVVAPGLEQASIDPTRIGSRARAWLGE